MVSSGRLGLLAKLLMSCNCVNGRCGDGHCVIQPPGIERVCSTSEPPDSQTVRISEWSSPGMGALDRTLETEASGRWLAAEAWLCSSSLLRAKRGLRVSSWSTQQAGRLLTSGPMQSSPPGRCAGCGVPSLGIHPATPTPSFFQPHPLLKSPSSFPKRPQ